jgi:hypothetical protein
MQIKLKIEKISILKMINFWLITALDTSFVSAIQLTLACSVFLTATFGFPEKNTWTLKLYVSQMLRISPEGESPLLNPVRASGQQTESPLEPVDALANEREVVPGTQNVRTRWLPRSSFHEREVLEATRDAVLKVLIDSSQLQELAIDSRTVIELCSAHSDFKCSQMFSMVGSEKNHFFQPLLKTSKHKSKTHL